MKSISITAAASLALYFLLPSQAKALQITKHSRGSNTILKVIYDTKNTKENTKPFAVTYKYDSTLKLSAKKFSGLTYPGAKLLNEEWLTIKNDVENDTFYYGTAYELYYRHMPTWERPKHISEEVISFTQNMPSTIKKELIYTVARSLDILNLNLTNSIFRNSILRIPKIIEDAMTEDLIKKIKEREAAAVSTTKKRFMDNSVELSKTEGKNSSSTC